MSYAGYITPETAERQLEVVLVDVRTDAERRFVGVPDIAELSCDLVMGGGRASTADAARGSSRK